MWSRDTALYVEHASSGELASMKQSAREIREKAWGNVVTYSRKVFVPLTNLCRDKCGYCTFAKQPGEPGAGYMTPDEVMQTVARAGRHGCKEALFSLGEKPELRYPEAAAALCALGYSTTMNYVIAMCERVLSETTLIPHVNAGTLSDEEVMRLKNVAGSVGLMLENVSRRLVRPGMAHHACPDKVPVQRLRTLERAGKHHLPTTTGILIGIGETWTERVDSLIAIAELHGRHGHIQEVIVQNFRAKPGTLMQAWRDPGIEDMVKTLTVARHLLPPEISLQAPPNLAEAFETYLEAGINDWGGISPVTADFINPERAWPAIQEIAARTASHGLTLAERLTVYPRFLAAGGPFLGQRMEEKLHTQMRPDGLARVQCHVEVPKHTEEASA